MTDTANCGTCGKTCGTGQQCVGGSCVCPAGTLNCSGTCESPTTANSCGTSCTAACAGPTNGGSVGTATCTGSTCGISCNSGLTNCSKACVNTNTDSSNCGSCGHACPSGQACSGGTCNCTGATHMCNGACVSNTDPNNCGTACNTNCPGPTTGTGSAVCAGNSCTIQCSSGTQCGTACVACPVGGVCSGNTCGCPAGQSTNCSGTCVDLTSNTTNCGRCGHSCFYGSCNATAGATGGPGCTSWTVATSPTTSSPAAIVSDGTNLIWADQGLTSILEIAVSGKGAVKTLMQNSAFSTIQAASIFPMSLGGGKVAWATTSNLWTVGVDGSSPRRESFTFPAGQLLLNVGINTTATWIGVVQETSTSPGFELYECPVGGSASSCKAVSGLGFIPVGAATNSTNYYFRDNNTAQVDVLTFGVSPALGAVETGQAAGMTRGDRRRQQLRLLDRRLSYGIRRAQQIGGAVSNVTTFPSGTGLVLATDGTNVYFTTNGSPNFVGYAPVNGSAGSVSTHRAFDQRDGHRHRGRHGLLARRDHDLRHRRSVASRGALDPHGPVRMPWPLALEGARGAARTRSSLWSGPTICMPTGRPARDIPARTLAAGCHDMLNGIVNDATRSPRAARGPRSPRGKGPLPAVDRRARSA